MLSQKDSNMMAAFAALIGGCASIGLMMLALAIVALITVGINIHALIIFGVFGAGTIVSYVLLKISVKKIEREALKQLGIDDDIRK